MTNRARSAALNAVRFACRVQILTRRLNEARAAREANEESFHGDLEGGLPAEQAPGEDAFTAALLDRASMPPAATPPGRLSTPGVAGASPTSYISQKTNNMAILADLAVANHGHVGSWVVSDLRALGSLIINSWVSVLLVFCPIGIASGLLGWGASITFFTNFLVLIPLAMTLGDVTEDLALRMGDVSGGLLNATFGNVTELVLSIAALRQGLLDVVADSLLGSILSNLLLVLGCCFLLGGIKYKTQTFNATSNRAFGSLLFLSSIGIALPTAAATMISNPDRPQWILQISRGVAVVLLICYVSYLVFQLYTHHDLFDDMDCESVRPGPIILGARTPDLSGTPPPRLLALPVGASPTSNMGGNGLDQPFLGVGVGEALLGFGEEDEDEGHELPVISATGGVVALALISALVAVHSEFLTGAIQETSSETGISTGFLAVIVLPIAGNACEHITAVMVAMKNKMDLSLGIAIGSSLQIALFAIPFMVILGWIMGQPMSLDYDLFSVVVLVLSAIHANLVSADAKSHWLMGVQLCAVYVVIAVCFWFR